MPVRSMTGFAQVNGIIAALNGAAPASFTLSLKSVNHRFLDLHLRLPAETDTLEMKVRRILKEKLARGHIELTLSLDQSNGNQMAVNRPLVEAYVQAFRAAARDFGIAAEPDLNAIFRMPGALGGAMPVEPEALEPAVLAALGTAVTKLNDMRAEEGRGIERELRDRIQRLRSATFEIEKFRSVVLKANFERLQTRLRELLSTQMDHDRMMQEAAVAADRGDIQEEIARMNTHLDHFLGLLGQEGEI